MNFILNMIPAIREQEIDKTKRCGTCKFYDKKSDKYGVCLNEKSNKFIKFVHDQSKKAIIQVPKLGICKFYNVIDK